MSPLIEHTFIAAGQSPAVRGSELGRNEPHNYTGLRSTKAAWQIVQTTGNGAFSAHLERGFRRADGAITWDIVGKAVTASGTVTDVDLVPGAEYRINVTAIVATEVLVGIFN